MVNALRYVNIHFCQLPIAHCPFTTKDVKVINPVVLEMYNWVKSGLQYLKQLFRLVDKPPWMLRSLLFFLFTGITILHGQTIVNKSTPKVDSFPKIATVDVSVTDFKARPKAGEQVIFQGETTGQTFTGISNASGKLKQLLPPGDTYHVSIKSISDTNSYAAIVIPALKEDEYFTDPFWVRIEFEPARSYRLDHVHFDIDKASLRPDSFSELKELQDYLERHPSIKVEIAGHTDNTGTDTHNLKLSQDRANTIRNYLLKKGIKAGQVTAKGYGATQPVADNNTDEGKQLNRRTEVRVL